MNAYWDIVTDAPVHTHRRALHTRTSDYVPAAGERACREERRPVINTTEFKRSARQYMSTALSNAFSTEACQYRDSVRRVECLYAGGLSDRPIDIALLMERSHIDCHDYVSTTARARRDIVVGERARVRVPSSLVLSHTHTPL